MSDLDCLLTGLFAAGDAGYLDSFDRYLHFGFRLTSASN